MKQLLRLLKGLFCIFSCHYSYAVGNALIVTCWEKGLVLLFKFTKSSRKPITPTSTATLSI